MWKLSWADAMKVPLAVLAIVTAGLLAHVNGLSGALVFDDKGAILDNPTIRQLWPPGEILSPPKSGLPVTGRPLTNLSLAINYAVHGTRAWGYHVVNLSLHLLCAVTLFGLVRRTLLQPRLHARFADTANEIATATALLWVVHPLTTGAVTYVSQRAESLASLLILVALYCFARHRAAPHPGRWLAGTIVATWLGIGSKEICAMIPIGVLAYEHLFLVGRGDWSHGRRWMFYGLLFASWLPLAGLILASDNRGATWAGDSGFTPWQYARLQAQALVHYLRLLVWPAPLVFDYGRNLPIPSLLRVIPHALFVVVLLVATAMSWRRWPAAAFAGLVFFAVLAPSSSVVPIADAIFEHRMYLPAAAVLAILIGLGWRWFGRRLWLAVLPATIALAATTIDRNNDYRTPLALWQDTVEKRPENARARGNLGEILLDEGRHEEAVRQFEAAYHLTPYEPIASHNLAVGLDLAGRREAAIAHYRESLALQPRNVLARTNLAKALAEKGALDEALVLFRDAVREAPNLAEARAGYGRALLRAGRTEDAIEQFQRAVELTPENADRVFSLGEALARAGRMDDAIDAFQSAIALRPDHVPALTNLGNALLLTRKVDEAIAAYRTALGIRHDATTHANLGLALALARRFEEAVDEFEAALELEPSHPVALAQLHRLRQRLPRGDAPGNPPAQTQN